MDPSERADGPHRYANLLANRAYLRVFSAGLGSVLGSALAQVCIVWIVYTSTGSALSVALIAVAYLAGSIVFSLVGGVLADRYDRRRLMIASDIVRAVTLGVVVAALEVRGFDLAMLIGANFLIGAFYTVFNPAEMAIVPSIVGAAEVADANGLVRSSRSAAQFVGAAIAGALIVSVGPFTGIACNAATFAVSAFLLYGMRVPAVARPAARAGGWLREIRGGFAWLGQASGFLQLTVSAAFFNFCIGLISTFLIVFSAVLLHGSALVYALLLASEVAGTALGSLLVGPLRAARFTGLAWTLGCGVASGGAALLLVLVVSAPVAYAALFALGVLTGFGGTAWLTGAQLLVPPEIQGRYFGIDNLGSVATIPVAEIGGALLITAYGVRLTFLATALLWIATGLLFLLPRSLRTLGVHPSGGELSRRTDVGAAGTNGSHEGTRVA